MFVPHYPTPSHVELKAIYYNVDINVGLGTLNGVSGRHRNQNRE